MVGQLYAIMNPIRKLAVVGPLAVERPAYVRKITATVVVVVVYVLASIFALAGGFILSAFGVSIDSFRIAGGVVLLNIYHDAGLRLLCNKIEITEEQAVVPLAMPLIVGPGTIVALIVISSVYGPLVAFFSGFHGVDCSGRCASNRHKSNKVRRRHTSEVVW